MCSLVVSNSIYRPASTYIVTNFPGKRQNNKKLPLDEGHFQEAPEILVQRQRYGTV
jgi:hypothetical protein